MSNIISAEHDPGAEDVVMRNGMTSVFLSVLLLSGSDLAHSDQEVATVAWLAEHDQATVGLGVVGFGAFGSAERSQTHTNQPIAFGVFCSLA